MLGMLPGLVPRTIPVSVTAGAQRRPSNLTAAQRLRQRFDENIVLTDVALRLARVPFPAPRGPSKTILIVLSLHVLEIYVGAKPTDDSCRAHRGSIPNRPRG